MTENTTASGAADLPEFPSPPEPQIMMWNALEIVVIRKYGADMFRAGRLAASAPVAPTPILTLTQQRHLLRNPEAIKMLMDIEDCGYSEAEAMAEPGELEAWPTKRWTALKELGRSIVAEDPELWPNSVLRTFGFPAPEAAPVASTRQGDQFLCKAWGETDLPAAAIVTGLEGVSAFLVEQWLGDADHEAYDGTKTLPSVMQDMQDEWAVEGEAWEWSTEFEIGGISVQKVGHPCPEAAPVAPAPQPSPTAGMNMVQRILHVGGRNPPGSTYVEFGSIQAVEALVKQVQRDLPRHQCRRLPDHEIVTMYAECPSSDAEMLDFAHELMDAMLAPTLPAEQVATTDDPGPFLDDAGCAMVANSHHYTPENIRALVKQLRAFSDPQQTTQADWDALDWRGHCNVLWRVMSALADEVVPAAPLQQGEYLPLPECDATTVGLGAVWNRHGVRAAIDADRAARGAAQASPAPVAEDAANWHWLASYLVGPRTDLDDEIVASESVNDLRKLVSAARARAQAAQPEGGADANR